MYTFFDCLTLMLTIGGDQNPRDGEPPFFFPSTAVPSRATAGGVNDVRPRSSPPGAARRLSPRRADKVSSQLGSPGERAGAPASSSSPPPRRLLLATFFLPCLLRVIS
ncbi:uncharacterized protein LOC144198627 [Stigmatopora nigra]